MVRQRLLGIVILTAAALCATNAESRDLNWRGRPDDGAANSWFGEQMNRGAALAVADINAAGGVLGQQVQLITVDDFCDPEQAVAAAKKLVGDGVIFVVGHYCSGAFDPGIRNLPDGAEF